MGFNLNTILFSHTLRDVKDWTIQLGITRRHTHSYYGQEVGVRMAIPHPQYDAYVAHDNDIALFQVKDLKRRILQGSKVNSYLLAGIPRCIPRTFVAGLLTTEKHA